MGGNIISRLLFDCRHQFSWPRRDENGDYYQLCVTCGTKYQYDWDRMRRIAPVEDTPQSDESKSKLRRCGTKSAWTPRERRLKHEVPVSFRTVGSEEWQEGTTENISRSGVLFRSLAALEPQSRLEVKFEMPKEVTGDTSAVVICQATVRRVTENAATKKHPQTFNIACAIAGYEFAEKKAESAAAPTSQVVSKPSILEFAKRHRKAR